jgi:cytochrome c-type biogenesis protein CcmF
MGGAWAYEALSFGGYWAWDPVENMSLVPWIMLLAALHGNFIARHTGHSIKATYLFYIISFLLILYSTFLTRSGILGEESVHAFTEMGLEWQLIGFIGLFAIIGGYLFVSRNKSIPVIHKEEKIQSREFWMFVGALILSFSAVLITFTTSIPVWNKLVDVYGSIMGKGDMTPYHRAMPLDPVDHHNRFQLWIAVLVSVLSAVTLMLRFQGMGWEEHKSKFYKHLAICAVGGAVFAYLLSLWINITSWQYMVLIAAAAFGVVTNINYLISFAKKNITAMGSALSHGGFALMLIGIAASGLNKQTVSRNEFAQEGLAQGLNPGENAFLIRDEPMFMQGYWVTYKSDTLKGLTREYEVEFLKKDEKGDTVEHFTTFPNVLYDRQMSKVETANPDTKRYLNRDMFTYIAGLPPEIQDSENIRTVDSLLTYNTYALRTGDSLHSGKLTFVLDSITLGSHNSAYHPEENDLALSGNLTVLHADHSEIKKAYPTLIIRKGLLYGMADQINDFNVRFRLKSEMIDTLMPPDETLTYEPLTLHPEETTTWNGLQLTLRGIDKNVDHPSYAPDQGDIAFHAVLDITDARNNTFVARPLYFIREGSPYNMKAFVPGLGLHLRLERIEPESEEFHFFIAQPVAHPQLIVELAEEVPRNDYIVLEAILFPGINLFWGGSLIMLMGMFIGLYKRLRKK